jgi:hypothetical protein
MQTTKFGHFGIAYFQSIHRLGSEFTKQTDIILRVCHTNLIVIPTVHINVRKFSLKMALVYQYNETNVMHFSFNLLRIKSLYMFRALLAHPQKVQHKRHLVYCVRAQPTDITRTHYNKCRLCSAS